MNASAATSLDVSHMPLILPTTTCNQPFIPVSCLRDKL